MLTLLQLSVDGDPQARPHGQPGVAVAAEHMRCPPRPAGVLCLEAARRALSESRAHVLRQGLDGEDFVFNVTNLSREHLADDLIHSHSVNWQDFLRVNPDSEWAVSAACISSQGSRGESGLPWTWGFLLHCADCFSKLLQGPQLRWKALPEYWELVWETRHLVQAVETTLGEAEFQSSRQLLLGKAQLREDRFSHSQSWLCQLWVKWFPEKLSLSKSSFLWELFYWKAVENLLAMM